MQYKVSLDSPRSKANVSNVTRLSEVTAAPTASIASISPSLLHRSLTPGLRCCDDKLMTRNTTDMARYFGNKSNADPQVSELISVVGDCAFLRPDYRDKLNLKRETLQKQFENDAQTVGGSNMSVYTGRAGHVYMYLYLALRSSREDKANALLVRAWSWLQPCLKQLRGRRIAFLNGDPGPLALAAVICHKLMDHVQRDIHLKHLHEFHTHTLTPDHPDEILYGRSGYLHSLFFVQLHLGPDFIESGVVAKVVQYILKSGRDHAKRTESPF
eukprot:snap_masked-scaffold670_size114954-processed-gene-0.16 protein:Tk01660 transcript:snap_masked-scaffold670_size114954-processed-gene-0.16-mRNA-1 annotation:"lanc-like protein 2-like"